MPRIDAVVEIPTPRGFRVQQVSGMFDVSFAEKLQHEWHIEAPFEDNPWKIGAIVGASGSGKSTIARHLFGDRVHSGFTDWPHDACFLDAFPRHLSISDITAALTAVGFSSPPSWAKPFRVLSVGESFRAELARLIVDGIDPLVVDEFTSTVDRQVASVCSMAVAKAIRRQETRRLVAVSCHRDILPWLQPDWIIDVDERRFDRVSLQRPPIKLDIRAGTARDWDYFKQHHYLSAKPCAWSSYVAMINGERVAYCSIAGYPGKNRDRYLFLTRVVVKPDYQGVGVAKALRNFVAERHCRVKPVRSVSANPAIAAICRPPRWRCVKDASMAGKCGLNGRCRNGGSHDANATSFGRMTRCFEYIPETQL